MNNEYVVNFKVGDFVKGIVGKSIYFEEYYNGLKKAIVLEVYEYDVRQELIILVLEHDDITFVHKDFRVDSDRIEYHDDSKNCNVCEETVSEKNEETTNNDGTKTIKLKCFKDRSGRHKKGDLITYNYNESDCCFDELLDGDKTICFYKKDSKIYYDLSKAYSVYNIYEENNRSEERRGGKEC